MLSTLNIFIVCYKLSSVFTKEGNVVFSLRDIW